MRDIRNNLAVVQALAPIVIAATTTTPSIDLLDFNSAMAVVNTGAIVGSGNFTAKLQESDDGTTFTDVAAADQHGAFPTALAAASVVKVGYKGYKRYIRVVITLNSGTSIAASVLIIKGNAAKKPVA